MNSNSAVAVVIFDKCSLQILQNLWIVKLNRVFHVFQGLCLLEHNCLDG